MERTHRRTLCCAATLLAAGLSSPARSGAQPVAPEAKLIVQTGHQEQIELVAFSPDSRLIASGDSRRGSIRMWEAQSGKQLRAIAGFGRGLYALRFSPDGRLLVAAGGRLESAEVKVWDVATGRELRSFTTGGRPHADGLAVSADGSLVAVAGDSVRIWNVAFTTPIASIAVDSHTTLAFSPRESLLAIRDAASLRFWSPDQPSSASIRLGNKWGEREIVFLSNGATLAVPDGDAINIVDVARRRISGRIAVGDGARLFSRPHSDNELVVGVSDRYEVWDLATRKKLRDLPRKRTDAFPGEVPSPSWRWMAVPMKPSHETVTVEDLEGGRDPLLLGGRVAPAGAVAFSADGSLLATKTGGHFWVWDLGTGVPRIFDGHREPRTNYIDIKPMSLSGSGRRHISADNL